VTPLWVHDVRVTVRPVTERVRTTIGAGLLLVAVGASACSVSSSLGRNLPIAVDPIDTIVHPTKCTLSSSGNQATATGRFDPPASVPVDANGHQVGSLELQLHVLTSQTRLGVHDVGVGETSAGISVGQTTWHLVAPIEGLPGLRPTHCSVNLAPQF
jgi:hypothetical protein